MTNYVKNGHLFLLHFDSAWTVKQHAIFSILNRNRSKISRIDAFDSVGVRTALDFLQCWFASIDNRVEYSCHFLGLLWYRFEILANLWNCLKLKFLECMTNFFPYDTCTYCALLGPVCFDSIAQIIRSASTAQTARPFQVDFWYFIILTFFSHIIFW